MHSFVLCCAHIARYAICKFALKLKEISFQVASQEWCTLYVAAE